MSAFTATAKTINIDVSGSNGGYSQDGGDAGDVNLALSYADAAKTQVKIEGEEIFGRRSIPISKTIPLADLNAINIYANGGDGGAGLDGRDGYNGQDGMNGYDGCPPTNGSNGSDGGDGGDGGPGGNGGNGGRIHVSTPASQTELMLLVHLQAASGSGGQGGSGGRGGSGGQGGRGGSNTCRDQNGNPTNGPDGQNGWSGNSGRDGSSGSSGYNGRSGSKSYDVVENGKTVSYPSPFSLHVTDLKTVDQNDDGILQPGEKLFLTSLTLTNSGAMPTPSAQILKLLFQNTTTLKTVTLPEIQTGEIAPHQSRTLTFAQGAAALQAAHDAKLIGHKATTDEVLAINNVKLSFANETGYALHWPIGVDALADSGRAYFKSAEPVKFSLHNVSSKNIGPNGTQPAEVEFSWISSTVPGSDISVALPDGRKLTLGQPQIVTNLEIPAKSKLALPLNFLAGNSKNRYTGSGKLRVTLRLKNMNGADDDLVDLASTSMFMAIDLRPIAVNRHVQIAGTVRCNYPNRVDPEPLESVVDGFDLSKTKGSDRIAVHYYMEGQRSPAYVVPAFDFAPYTDLLHSNSKSLSVAFLNDMLAHATANSTYWHFSGCY